MATSPSPRCRALVGNPRSDGAAEVPARSPPVALGGDRLGSPQPAAARAIATTSYEQLAISDVTLQEIGLLLHAGRIEFQGSPKAVLGRLLNYVSVLPITLEIAVAAPALPLPDGDQFDRIITATAKAHRLPLITKDANIANPGVVATVW